MSTAFESCLARTREIEPARPFEIAGRPGARLTGWKIADASSRRPGSRRWAEVAAYLTESGKLIASQVGRTCIEGEQDRATWWVCRTPEEIQFRLGYGRLAQKLYERMGVETLVID